MRIVIQIEEPRCKGLPGGSMASVFEEEQEGKCGWSDMSNEKRVREDNIEEHVSGIQAILRALAFTLTEIGS